LGDAAVDVVETRDNWDEQLHELIRHAVERFGPRWRATWSIEKVLVQGDNFPETIVDDARQSIRVRVTNLVRLSADEARYELSHESIHCLLATGRRDTIYFEEGLANFYALTLPSLSRQWRRAAKAKLPKILKMPYEAFCALRPTDARVKALRDELPDIDELTPSLVEKHFKVPAEVAAVVCRRMERDRPNNM
jgi:hypothetical protein